MNHVYALTCLTLLLVVPLADAGDQTAPIGLGYGGQRDFVARESSPPLTFDETTGRNILWRTTLPTWCLGAPTVAGGKVFVMAETDRDHDWPVLLCLDGQTGKILWKREIDHVALMDLGPDEKVKVRKAWRDFLEFDRLLYTSWYAYRTAESEEAAEAVLKQHGLKTGRKGQVGKLSFAEKGKPFATAKIFNRAGLYFDVWHWSGMARIGYAYPTPVTDGQHVFVATGLHAFGCYDLDGNVIWERFVPGQGTSNRGYGGNDFCKNARNPLLYRDLLISDVGNTVRAMDKSTGKLVWSHDRHVKHAPIVSPVVLTTGGRDVLLTFGPSAFLLPEGKPIPIEGWGNHGASMLVKSDEPDVVFFTGGGEHGGWKNKGRSENPPPAAVRFRLAGQTLKAEVLWSGIKGQPQRRHTGMVYRDGKLYHPDGVILEAGTGKILAGEISRRRGRNATPETRHMLWIAAGRVYGLREVRKGKNRGDPEMGRMQVFDLEGKKLAEMTIDLPKRSAERTQKIIETRGGPEWDFSYGCPFLIHGDRIYIRSNDELICIGRK